MVCPLCKNTNFTIRKKELGQYTRLCTTVEDELVSLELIRKCNFFLRTNPKRMILAKKSYNIFNTHMIHTNKRFISEIEGFS